MATKTNLENGDTIKTVNIEGKEVSSVDGNVFTVTKSGLRKGEDEKRTAMASRTFITREEIDTAIEQTGGNIGAMETEQVCLDANQTYREDAINQCSSEIRGDGANPIVSQAKLLAKLINSMSVEKAQGYVAQIADEPELIEALTEILGVDKMESLQS